MTQFLQLHLLTSYPPSNLNRDDLGRPKTAVVGGRTRLRISSQSLKRAWRTSELFEDALAGHQGQRTKARGYQAYLRLIAGGYDPKKAYAAARALTDVFAKLEGEAKKLDDPKELEKSLQTLQLVHYSPEEIAAVNALVDRLLAGEALPEKKDLALLRKHHKAADVALFGRMLAENPDYNTDAACQVAHAITVHAVEVEDDFFSAVDDLNTGAEDAGAGHLGETEFGAGLFYLYICIDRDRLVENLSDDEGLARTTLRALVESAATVAPSGKQNSFASRAYASYILAEKGSAQPRSLAVAFLKPVQGSGNFSGDYLGEAISRLEDQRKSFDDAYGNATEHSTLNVAAGEGKLADVLDFVAGA